MESIGSGDWHGGMWEVGSQGNGKQMTMSSDDLLLSDKSFTSGRSYETGSIEIHWSLQVVRAIWLFPSKLALGELRKLQVMFKLQVEMLISDWELDRSCRREATKLPRGCYPRLIVSPWRRQLFYNQGCVTSLWPLWPCIYHLGA